MWTCPACGTEIEDQFQECWECAGSGGEPHPEPPVESRSDPGAEPGPADADEMLQQILSVLADQTKTLAGIEFRVGCMFAFMVLVLVIWVIVWIAS